ncbi:MAG: threonine--tRNA ligase [Candidatus Micrarchaeia archaeon]
MKILTIHSDFIEFQPLTKAIKAAETVADEKKRIDDCLVVFTSIEEGDDEGVIENTKREIVAVAEQVKAKRIVIYPFVHLSSKPAKPGMALEYLKELEKISGYEVTRAPFGWYKSFNIKCKGHPLAELSREIKPSSRPAPGVIDERRPAGSEAKDRYLILAPDGKEYDLDSYNYKHGEEGFRILVEKEGKKVGLKTEMQEPEYMKICRKYGISWEPMSDVGHMRYAPKGALIFDLIADYSKIAVDSLGLSVMQVRGTCMFNLNEKAVSEHAELFGDRLYSLDIDRNSYVMRYAACHQQFAMIKDWIISHKQLPFGAFEIADSYRYEQSGETLLCFRLRRFFMPDFHVFCRTMDEAKNWFSNIHSRIFHEARALGRDYEMLVNVSSEKYYKDAKDMLVSLLKKENKPALVHFYPEGKNYYWTVNIEYNIIDSLNRPREIGTVQIDIGNWKRFGISYIDENGTRQGPIILHSAIIGGIERYMYMVFDTAVKTKKETGRIQIPLWLNPEQVRILPMTERHLPKAREIADLLEKNNIRVGLDDRNETMNKKVMSAKQDWIGYVVVIGDREMQGGNLSCYIREKNKNIEIPISDLITEIKEKTKGMPFRRMYEPREMSRRPIID